MLALGPRPSGVLLANPRMAAARRPRFFAAQCSAPRSEAGPTRSGLGDVRGTSSARGRPTDLHAFRFSGALGGPERVVPHRHFAVDGHGAASGRRAAARRAAPARSRGGCGGAAVAGGGRGPWRLGAEPDTDVRSLEQAVRRRRRRPRRALGRSASSSGTAPSKALGPLEPGGPAASWFAVARAQRGRQSPPFLAIAGGPAGAVRVAEVGRLRRRPPGQPGRARGWGIGTVREHAGALRRPQASPRDGRVNVARARGRGEAEEGSGSELLERFGLADRAADQSPARLAAAQPAGGAGRRPGPGRFAPSCSNEPFANGYSTPGAPGCWRAGTLEVKDGASRTGGRRWVVASTPARRAPAPVAARWRLREGRLSTRGHSRRPGGGA